MKNIHLLPTDKPSRLFKTGNFLLLDSRAMPNNTLETINQNIYITSSEEIKEGDIWYDKTIILTTDEDLIKDGVQAIDDEFLEWFVKNPSCEFVEIGLHQEPLGEVFNGKNTNTMWTDPKYKIIIPQEEQKQHLIDIMRGDEELGLYKENKKETLEEAAEKYADFSNDYVPLSFGDKFNETTKKDFINGAKSDATREYWYAKWQEEQDKNKYTEEEVLAVLQDYCWYRINEELNRLADEDTNTLTYIEWFEKFKKK